MERLNKKGQGLSLTTIILIVLGLAVLVFLIWGFSTGWGSLWSTITQIGGGDANVDDVKRGCELACSTQAKDAFCTQSRTMKFGEERDIIDSTPDEEKDESSDEKSVKSVSGSCKQLVNRYGNLGIADCPGLC